MNINLYKIKNDFTLVILDHRIQVIDGSRKPDFVGYMRSGVGIAWLIGTKSGNNYVFELYNKELGKIYYEYNSKFEEEVEIEIID